MAYTCTVVLRLLYVQATHACTCTINQKTSIFIQYLLTSTWDRIKAAELQKQWWVSMAIQGAMWWEKFEWCIQEKQQLKR